MGRLWQGQSSAALVVVALALFVAAIGPASAIVPAEIAVSRVSKALGLAKKARRQARQAKRIARRANRRSKRVAMKTGPQGLAGSPGSPAQVLDKLRQVDGAGSQLDSDQVDGIDSTQLFRYGSTIPSGATITGVFREEVDPTDPRWSTSTSPRASRYPPPRT